MTNKVDTDKFIKSYLKYNASRKYVGNLTAGMLHNLRCVIAQTENNGCGFFLHCGHINTDKLLAAFARQMAYNPLRFTMNIESDIAANISKNIRRLIYGFNKLWPNGIAECVRIIDVSDPQFRFMIELRDCFKSIALRNMEDFKRKEYRDEIVAYFANATDIIMSANMRYELHQRSAATLYARDTNREINQLNQRIAAIEREMNIHRAHDREFYIEMQAEHDLLKARLEKLSSTKKPEKKNAVVPVQQITPVSPRTSAASALSRVADDDASYDALEREEELLRTMTPEHVTDELFQEYAEQLVGVRLRKYNNYQH